MVKSPPQLAIIVAAAVAVTSSAFAQSPQVLDPDATRYLAMGDSIAAGYKLAPITQAYPFLLYQEGAFDRMPHTLFEDIAATGAASADVLNFQVPQAVIPFALGGFNPRYITLTVGGNDLVSVYRFATTHPNPVEVQQFAAQVLANFQQNLTAIIIQLRANLPGVKIFVANQYTIPQIQALLPFATDIVVQLNNIIRAVVLQFPSDVYLVDIFNAFLDRNNLLWADRPSAQPLEVHVTAVGHRVMAKAFGDVIAANK